MEAEMTMLNKPRQNDDETRSASWPTDDGHRGNRMSLETATLLAACLSGFLFQVDLTALAAALPDIGHDLGAASARAAWVIDVYSLALIFCLPIAGSLADRYGRVQMFTWGAGLFGLASLLCACANTLDVLLTFRTLQGIAGACITSTSSALLAGAYEGPRRARAFGLWGTIVGASMVAGPPLGSLLAGTIGWRWIFWINLPLCAVLVFLALCRIGNGLDQQRSSAKVDWLGAGLLAITSAALAFMLLEAPALGGIASATFAGIALNVLGRRLGRLVVQIGLALTALGVLGIMWTVLSLGPQLTSTSLILPMVIGGGGMGFAVSLVFDFALGDVPLSDAGAASGVLNAFQQTGAAIGVSTVGALFFAMMPTDPKSPSWATASSDAFAHALWLPVAMVAVSFAASFLLPRKAAHHDVL